MDPTLQPDWKALRKARRLRQCDLGPMAGMSTSLYSQIERGEVEPTPWHRECLEKILEAYPVIEPTKAIEPVRRARSNRIFKFPYEPRNSGGTPQADGPQNRSMQFVG